MGGSKAFIDDLRRTIAAAARGDATSLALNMFRSYKKNLYLEFDVRSSNLLTREVKTQVSDVLADLRLEILHVESTTCEQPLLRATCWVVRREIEMSRRALALRRELPDDALSVTSVTAQLDGERPRAIADRNESGRAAGVVVTFACQNPWRRRRCILQSIDSISRSRRRLAR